MKLFEIESNLQQAANPTNTCRTCVHRQRWQFGGRVIQYCGVRKSNRTDNGLLKIKVTTPACLKHTKTNEE